MVFASFKMKQILQMLWTLVVGSRQEIWFKIVLFFVLTLILTVILAGGQEATSLLAGQVRASLRPAWRA